MPDVDVDTDCITGEVIVREYTPKGQAQRDKEAAEAKKQESAAKVKADEREAAIGRLRTRAKTDADYAALLLVFGLD